MRKAPDRRFAQLIVAPAVARTVTRHSESQPGRPAGEPPKAARDSGASLANGRRPAGPCRRPRRPHTRRSSRLRSATATVTTAGLGSVYSRRRGPAARAVQGSLLSLQIVSDTRPICIRPPGPGTEGSWRKSATANGSPEPPWRPPACAWTCLHAQAARENTRAGARKQGRTGADRDTGPLVRIYKHTDSPALTVRSFHTRVHTHTRARALVHTRGHTRRTRSRTHARTHARTQICRGAARTSVS